MATDGNRLAKRTVPAIEFDDDLATLPQAIVPSDAVAIITKMLDKKDDVVVELSDAQIRVAAGGTTVTSKLVDGTFALMPTPRQPKIPFVPGSVPRRCLPLSPACSPSAATRCTALPSNSVPAP